MPASSDEHPAGHHLADRGHVAVGPVLGRRAAVERRDRAQRGAPERAELVLVDRLHGAAAGRRQLAAAGDPHRVVAASSSTPCGADPDRERQPRELPERARARRAATSSSSPDRLRRRCAASPMPARRVVVRPGLHERAAAAPASRGPTSRARRRPGPAPGSSASSSPAPTSPERSSRRARPARASCAVGAALKHPRQLDQRGGVGRAAGGVRDTARVAGGDDHDLPPRAAGAPADHVDELAAGVARSAARSTGKPLALERPRDPRGRAPVARAARRGGRVRRSAIRAASAAARRPSNSTSAASPCGSGRGPALQGEHRQHDRQQRRHERRPVDARLEHVGPTYNSEGDGFRAADPSRRRRAVGPEAADLPAAQRGVRRGARARRPRGARPAARGQLRPRRARRDAAEAGRLRRLPPDPRAQHRADHHAHRQDRGDRQGPRPRAGRRRLHHQALLGARVPQPREGGPAPRRARPARRAVRGADPSTASCASTSSAARSTCATSRCG